MIYLANDADRAIEHECRADATDAYDPLCARCGDDLAYHDAVWFDLEDDAICVACATLEEFRAHDAIMQALYDDIEDADRDAVMQRFGEERA